MPDLRKDAAARRVDSRDDAAPASERVDAVEARDADAVGGRRVVDDRAFGDDEADAVLGTAPVVGGDVLVGDVARREVARHRRHHDAVWQDEPPDGEWCEQGAGVHRSIISAALGMIAALPVTLSPGT